MNIEDYITYHTDDGEDNPYEVCLEVWPEDDPYENSSKMNEDESTISGSITIQLR